MDTIENTIDHIGAKIKYYRLLNKISLSKLADEANISKSTLFGLEEGKSNPTISTLINIASTLNISLNELIGNSFEDSASNTNLTLISTHNDEQYKLYKLTLLPNELFKLKELEATNIEIEVIEGALSLIDKSATLYAGESKVVNYNRYFKALSNGAVAMLKIYKLHDNFYIKEDIFYTSASDKLLEKIIKNSRKKLISRVIFTSISPIGSINTQEYMNYIEFISNKESHYYIFRRYQGLLGGIKEYLKKIDAKNINLKELEEFINLAKIEPSLKRDRFELLNKSVIEDTKALIVDATKSTKKNLEYVESIFDINSSLIKNSNYILLIEELSNEINSKEQITLTLWLYRALESLFIIDEATLESSELSIYNQIIQSLPKALYFAYNGYLDISINTVKLLISNLGEIKDSGSKVIQNYIDVINHLETALKNYEDGVELTTINIVEALAKDLNLTIEVKELIAPAIGDSGLYAYLFKTN